MGRNGVAATRAVRLGAGRDFRHRVAIHAAIVGGFLLVGGWLFAAEAADSCLRGCPTGAPTSNTVITRQAYSLSNNPDTKFADWVAYKITKATIGKTADRGWKQDPDLAPEDTLAPSDYDGAPATLKIDRGHQAPLASFTNTADWKTLNYLSNITPQSTPLNQGPWEALESAERTLTKARGVSALYVITGTLYEKPMRPMPNSKRQHKVPSAYWKVIALEEGNTIRTAAFIMHQDAKRSDDYCNSLVTIGEVEERSNLTLFPNLSETRRRALGEQPGALVSQIGCVFIQESERVRVKRR